MLSRRSVLMILDAMTTAVTRPNRPRRDSWQMLVHNKMLAVNLLYSMVPGCARAVSALVNRYDRLPFGTSDLRVLNYGSDSSVFALELAGSRLVLKIERHSLGKGIPDLKELARYRTVAYRYVTRLYQGPYRFFPETHFVVMHGLLLGCPVVAAIQPLIAGKMKDLLGDFTDDALVRELSLDDHLRDQFLFFLDRTRESHRAHKWVVDLLGASNLMIVENNGVRQLVSVDSGMINFHWLKRNHPEKYRRYLVQVERMSKIANAVEAARQVAV
jgi:hypothetical protein